MGAEDLQSDGEVGSAIEIGGAAGHGDAGDAGEVGGDGENIREVFVQWVVGKGSDSARRGGRDGREDGIDVLKGGFKIPTDEGADFLGAAVVGVVVTG